MGAQQSAHEAPPTGEDWFRWLAELLPQLIWTCRGDGPCDYLSPQWVEYTGIPAQAQLGYAWLDQLHPDDRPRVQQAWTAIAPIGRQFDIEFRIRRHDGVYRWFKTRAAPLRNADGVVVKWFGSNTDIQDLRDAESALRQVNRDLEARVRERTEALATATAAAQSTATQLLAAQRMAKVGSWQLDVASGAVEWSEQLFRTMGLDPSSGAPPYPEQAHLFATDSWRRLRAAIEEAVRTGTGYELELEVHRPDDSTRWCVARAETARNAEGRVGTLTGTLQDVTELKEVQQALVKATERMQLATAAARIGVWDWDIAKNALSWDAIMHQLYDMQASSFGGSYEAWRTCVHPDDLAAAEQALAVAFEGGRQFDTAFRIIHRSTGVVRHLRGAAVVHRDDMGRPDRMVGVNWDVTEQREMEQALLSNDRLLREFVTHAPAAIAMLDRDMRYIQASDRWLQDYGLTGQDIIGRSHYDVLPNLPERWKETHQRVLRGAIERCDEDPFLRADGSMEWLQWEARPWLTPNGAVGGLMFFTQLITGRKLLESELQRQKEALERSNTELKQFAYVASHDLQEPLRAVAGCSQLLERRYAGQLDEQADELIRHIVEGSDRMPPSIGMHAPLMYAAAGETRNATRRATSSLVPVRPTSRRGRIQSPNAASCSTESPSFAKAGVSLFFSRLGRFVLGLAYAWGMRFRRAALLSFGCLLWMVGCSGDSDGGGSNADGQGLDWSNLNPPPNIDITSCFDVPYDESGACSSCCKTAGFSASSSINDDHCTCGEAPADDRDTVCAAEASEPTAAPCMSCCATAGFSGSTWVGGGDSGRCSCHGTRDSEICAGALAKAVPDEACFYCCLENGYLSAGYTNFGAQECTCVAP